LQPLRVAIPSLPVQALDATESGRVSHGNPIAARVHGSLIALVDSTDALVAVAERVGDALQPKLVLRDG
jgi:hypothetical protein